MFPLRKKHTAFYTLVLAGALLLLFPAFYNGYPLINADVGTYLHSGFKLFIPDDRPIVYGLVLRFFSLNGWSLWLAALAQAWAVSWLLLKIMRVIIGHLAPLTVLIIYTLLAFTTSLSWVTSEIIPDIGTPIAAMAMYLIIAGKESKMNLAVLYLIFIVASGTHVSHFMIFMLLLFFVLLTRKWFFPMVSRKYINTALILLSALSIAASLLNSRVYARSKHVFFMGSLLDKKILKPYLRETCPTENYQLCKYKDEMGDDPNWFIWDESSPLYKEGGWAATKPEYDKIINGILTSPHYLKLFAQKSVEFTWQQLLDFKIGDGNFPFQKDNNVYWAVEQHAPRDLPMYMKAWQHQELIIPKLETPNKVIYTTVCLSLILLPFLIWLNGKQVAAPMRFLLFITVLVVVVNAWNCATFSNVIGRYQCRVMWLFPFCALLLIAKLWSRSKPIKP